MIDLHLQPDLKQTLELLLSPRMLQMLKVLSIPYMELVEQIYRQAAFKCLTAANENVRIGALKVMLVANSKICETVVLPDIISKLKALEEKARRGVFVK